MINSKQIQNKNNEIKIITYEQYETKRNKLTLHQYNIIMMMYIEYRCNKIMAYRSFLLFILYYYN